MRFAVAFTALALFTACGCGTVAGRQNRDKGAPMVLLLNESDNGRTVALHAGESLRITLPENATTGFRWDPERWDREVVGMIAEEPHYPAVGQVGSGGNVEFLFQARKPGVGEIILREWRPWEGEPSVIARYRLHVEVQP